MDWKYYIKRILPVAIMVIVVLVIAILLLLPGKEANSNTVPTATPVPGENATATPKPENGTVFNSNKIVVVDKNNVAYASKITDILVSNDGSLFATDKFNKVILHLSATDTSLYAGVLGARDGYGEAMSSLFDSILSESYFGEIWGITEWRDGYAVTDKTNNVIRFILDGKVFSIGSSIQGNNDGSSAEAQFNSPTGLTSDIDGNLYVADTGNNLIRLIKSDGTVSSLQLSEMIQQPYAIAYYNNMLYVTSMYDSKIYSVNLNEECKVMTVAGGNGELSNPMGIAVDKNAIYIADTGNSAVKMIKDGAISTILDRNETNGNAYPVMPVGIEVQSDELYISDFTTAYIYKIKLN